MICWLKSEEKFCMFPNLWYNSATILLHLSNRVCIRLDDGGNALLATGKREHVHQPVSQPARRSINKNPAEGAPEIQVSRI